MVSSISGHHEMIIRRIEEQKYGAIVVSYQEWLIGEGSSPASIQSITVVEYWQRGAFLKLLTIIFTSWHYFRLDIICIIR